MEHPKISVIIVNFNCAKSIIDCLDSLMKTGYPNFKIIIVDNASRSDDFNELLKIEKFVKILKNNVNLGYAIANNIGIKYAIENYTPDFILILNPDTIVSPNFITSLYNALTSDEKNGIAAPIQCYLDQRDLIYSAGGLIFWYLGQHFMIWNRTPLKRFKNIPYKVHFVSGACMLIKCAILNKVQFPEEYFLQWEDVDFCTQVRQIGYDIVIVPSSIIWHKIGLTIRIEDRKYSMIYRGIKNRFIFFLKYTPTLPKKTLWVFCFCSITFPIYFYYYAFIIRDKTYLKALLNGMNSGLKYFIKTI